MALSSTNDAISGLTASMTEKGHDVFLDGYRTRIVTACQNEGCDFEFESPIIALSDETTENQVNIVCNDCVGEVEADDNEDEVSDEISAHEQSA